MTRGTSEVLWSIGLGWVMGLVFGIIAKSWWDNYDLPGVLR